MMFWEAIKNIFNPHPLHDLGCALHMATSEGRLDPAKANAYWEYAMECERMGIERLPIDEAPI